MEFCEKSLWFPQWGEMAKNWGQKHIILKYFTSILLYFFTYDGETIFIKPARNALKLLIHVFVITFASLKYN